MEYEGFFYEDGYGVDSHLVLLMKKTKWKGKFKKEISR